MKETPKHIAILCSRLDLPGGTERACVNLANLLCRHGHPTTLLIVDTPGGSFYTIDTGVQVKHIALHFGITETGNKLTRKIDLFRHIQQLKKMLAAINADVYIGSEYHLSVSAYLAKPNNTTQIIAWEHHHINWLKKNRFWAFLWKMVYSRIDWVVCQNATEKKLFERMGCRATVIPYSLPQLPEQKASLQEKKILSIGWLINRKGIDMVPAIAENVLTKHPDWHWKIIGSGEGHDVLLHELTRKNLQHRVMVASPASNDLSKEYLTTSIFVMTSRFECLPMVLLEAGSFGVPSVAFDCPTGPADIISDGKSGFLAPPENTDELAQRINALIGNPALRKQMGEEARLRSRMYTADVVYSKWQTIVSQNENRNA
jgi:glycosyltransferase involved in cell wall biosynthesis